MPNCVPNHTFENWSNTIRFKPRRFCQPTSEAKVIELVKQALGAGENLRTQGAGHSFSQLLPTNDTLVNLDELKTPITVNGKRVTVPAGIRLKNLIKELRKRDLGLKNIGSITEQSIAGAISTGTHGTGLRLGSISTQVVGMKLVTGTGDVRTITSQDAALLDAARINVGALGIITELTLECVDDYQLEYTAYWATFDEVIEKIDALNQENERMLLWWLLPPIGPKDKVVIVTKNPPDQNPGILSEAADLVPVMPNGLTPVPLPQDAEVLANMLLTIAPAGKGFRKIWQFVGNYDRVLTIPLLPVFHRECEYAIPVENTADALRAIRRVVLEGDLSLRLPIEVRFVAKDEILLSPANGRNVCYIGASTQTNATEVFERFEPIMKDLGGRPHWGKNFTLTRREVDAMYPGTHDAFVKVRRELDPGNVFANSLVQELFE